MCPQMALLEIKKYQKSTECLLQRAPFTRVVRQTVQQVVSRGMWQRLVIVFQGLPCTPKIWLTTRRRCESCQQGGPPGPAGGC
jgi:hypothetical protein